MYKYNVQDRDLDPVRKLVQRAHRQMGAGNMLKLLKNLRSIADKGGGFIDVGTLCSGCDLIMHALLEMVQEWKEIWDISLEVRHLFACEVDPERQKFIINTWAPQSVFADITKMHDDRAYCVRAGANVPN
mgnify:CR=1 FL=1